MNKQQTFTTREAARQAAETHCARLEASAARQHRIRIENRYTLMQNNAGRYYYLLEGQPLDNGLPLIRYVRRGQTWIPDEPMAEWITDED